MAEKKDEKEESAPASDGIAKKHAEEQPRQRIYFIPFQKADELSKTLQRNVPEDEYADFEEEEEEDDDDDENMILLDAPPNRNNLTRHNRVIIRTLEAHEVAPYTAQLHLNYVETSVLTINDDPISVESPFAKPIIAFDEYNRQYDLILIGEKAAENRMGFFLSGDWCRFIADHRLKIGDVVEFYFLGEDPDNCLIQLAIRYFRKPADRN